MIKHYIIRTQLYEEETKLDFGISPQIAVVIEHIYNKCVNYYEAERTKGYISKGDLLHAKVPLQGTEKLIIYIQDEELAMKLAKRWCVENTNEDHQYKVLGIDKNYSPLN